MRLNAVGEHNGQDAIRNIIITDFGREGFLRVKTRCIFAHEGGTKANLIEESKA